MAILALLNENKAYIGDDAPKTLRKYWMLDYKNWLVGGLCSFIALGFCVNSAFSKANIIDIASQSKNTFKSDIEGVQESMLFSSYWKDKLPARQSPILSQQQIANQNISLLHSNKYMNDLSRFADHMDKKEAVNRIIQSSKFPDSNRYYGNGSLVTKQNFDYYKIALNIQGLKKNIKIQFGMVVRRANLRTFPTSDAVFKTPDDNNLDRFQETALFPAEVVAVLHQSLDQNWYYIVSYNYSGWVKKADIAIGNKQQIFQYKNEALFLIITGDKVFTTFNPYRENVSNIQLDMGTKVMLAKKDTIPTSLDGQNTYASYVIKLPTRTDDGQLKFQLALIARNKDVHVGYLSFTRQNILNQSFKFLGERYGWGHSFNARDCTGFVGDVYKSFGILMPRNTGQQAQSSQGQNIHFTKSTSVNEKIAGINELEAGDLIYIPGHVMMYIGMQNNQPFIIHDVSGLSYTKKNGSYYKSTLNGVSVTPLLPLQLNQETRYLDRIYNLKKIK